MRYIFLDTETTGLSPAAKHRVIEIGAIEMVDRRLTGNTFHHYLNPKRAIDPGAQAVHGITAEFLADKPQFGDVAEAFIDFIKGATLIIHNAPFDVGFLEYELSLYKKGKLSLDSCIEDVIDTLVLARQTYPGQKNSLDALCKRLQINNSHRQFHGALLDSEILAEVYLAMTGGQQAMAWEAEAVAAQTATVTSIAAPVTLSEVVIVRASDAECALDEAYFQK